MRFELSFFLLALLGGCAGRQDADLLQSRIREQASQLSDSQREVAKTRAELKKVRQDADRLRAELEQAKTGNETLAEASVQISKLRIYPLASGGINKDSDPGDDAIVVQFSPLDSDGEPVKIPGDVEFKVLDLLLPEGKQKVGTWKFSVNECRKHWTRGITSSGYQFTLPLDEPPRHSELVIYVKFESADDQVVDTSRTIKVVPPAAGSMAGKKRTKQKIIQVVDELDDELPPLHAKADETDDLHDDDWGDDKSEETRPKLKQAIKHSANWTDATIPRYR